MSDLTSGRTEPCKDNLSGISQIYLADFVEYAERLMPGRKDMLLTSFPPTLIVEFESRQKKADENYQTDKYEQTISFTMAHQDLPTTQNLSLLLNKRVRAVIVDRKGGIKVYGLESGLDVDITVKSGGGKADFNGYEVNLKGLEQYQAPFINDLATTGFFTEGLAFDCLLSSSGRPSSIGDLVSSCNVLQSNP